jgi:hypothetical protein
MGFWLLFLFQQYINNLPTYNFLLIFPLKAATASRIYRVPLVTGVIFWAFSMTKLANNYFNLFVHKNPCSKRIPGRLFDEEEENRSRNLVPCRFKRAYLYPSSKYS